MGWVDSKPRDYPNECLAHASHICRMMLCLLFSFVPQGDLRVSSCGNCNGHSAQTSGLLMLPQVLLNVLRPTFTSLEDIPHERAFYGCNYQMFFLLSGCTSNTSSIECHQACDFDNFRSPGSGPPSGSSSAQSYSVFKSNRNTARSGKTRYEVTMRLGANLTGYYRHADREQLSGVMERQVSTIASSTFNCPFKWGLGSILLNGIYCRVNL